MECPNCGRKARIVFESERGNICSHCARYVYPVEMTICDIKATPRQLWNVEARNYEGCHNIDYFLPCGWFVRAKKSCIFRSVPRVAVDVYYMMYFGDLHCLRFLDYKYFNSLAPRCENSYCKDYPNQYGAYGPPERSIFKSWISKRYSTEK